MNMTFADFNTIPCVWLDNGHVRLAVTTNCGPRILFFGWSPDATRGQAGGAHSLRSGLPSVEGGNLLAELPDFMVQSFHFWGGHRLWAAPESLVHTYHPDDEPPLFRLADEYPDRGVHLSAAHPDAQQIVKEIEIVLAEDAPEVTLTHTLRLGLPLPPYHMTNPPVVAPWALTMFRLGGVAVLPLPHGPADADGLLPNRLLALWPYTQVVDPRLTWGDRFLLVEGRPSCPPFKVGWRSADGWLGYWLPDFQDLRGLEDLGGLGGRGGAGTLFTKHFTPVPYADYPDMGCNAECYTNDQFIEIETLGPLAQIIMPQVHVETWRLHAGWPRPTPEMTLPAW
jgi:hypothetical protein